MAERRFCNKPDRDFPKMKCGYPLPCPWHTVIIEKGVVKIPDGIKMNGKKLKRINSIADIFKV